MSDTSNSDTSNNTCNCPICKQAFTPPDGMTAEEHLANGVIRVYAELQRKATEQDNGSNLPCPRCGHYYMSDQTTRNALSRVADVSICDTCGNEEGMQAYQGSIKPITSWWIQSEILKTKQNIEPDA